MKKIIYTALLPLMLTACGNGKPADIKADKEKVSVENVRLSPPPASSPVMMAKKADPNKSLDADAIPGDVSKKLTKEGDISFETNNTGATRALINDSLSKLGGYVQEEGETTNADLNRKEFTLKVRIPSKNFDRFLTGVAAVADKIDSKNISIKDVTTEFIDISTQLANKKKLEESYLALLKRADKMADVLAIEDKLTEIRTDIESTQGQLNYLTKQVDYSTLDITFYTKQAAQDTGNTFGYKLNSAFENGWNSLGKLFFGIIGVWPFWLALIALVIGVRVWKKKRRKGK